MKNKELRTLKEFGWTYNGRNELLCLNMKHRTCCATCLKAGVIKIFNESLTIEEFGEKMVRFFGIQEENLK